MLSGLLGGLSNLGQIYSGFEQQNALNTQNQLRQLQLQNALAQNQIMQGIPGLAKQGVFNPLPTTPPAPLPGAPPTTPTTPSYQPGQIPAQPWSPPSPLPQVPSYAGALDPSAPQTASPGVSQFGGLGSAFPSPSGQPTPPSYLTAASGFGTGLAPPQGQLPGDPLASRGLGNLLPLPNVPQTQFGGLGPGPGQTSMYLGAATLDGGGQDVPLSRGGAAQPPSGGLGFGPMPQAPAAPQIAAAPDPAGADTGFRQVVQLESGGNMNIGVGAAGEVGPAQILPSTAAPYTRAGEDLYDPQTSIAIARRYYDDLFQSSRGDQAATLVGYNRGKGAMRAFQAAGDNLDALRGTKMMPSSEYQAAIKRAGGKGGDDSDAVTSAHTDMSRNLPQGYDAIGVRGAEQMWARMPQIPQQIHMMSGSQLAQAIDQSYPGASDLVKGAVFLKVFPMLNEAAKEQTAAAWQDWKGRMEQLEDIMKWRHETATEDKEKFGTLENFVDTATGQPVLGRSFTMPGGRIGVVDANGQPLDPSQLRRPMPGETGAGVSKYGTPETMQILDKDDAVVRTVGVRTKTGDPNLYEITADGKEKRLTWDESKGEHLVPMTAGAAATQRARAKEAAGPFSDSEATFWANYVAHGGALASIPGRTAAARNQVMKKIADMGIDPVELLQAQGTARADTASLAWQTRQADAAIGFEKTALANLEVATKALRGVAPTNLGPLINRWIETGETFTGDPSVPAETAAVITFANEYAKVMSGAIGAQGATVDARREAAELFNPYFSAGQWDRVAAIAKTDMANRERTLRENVENIRKRIGTGGQRPPAESTDDPATLSDDELKKRLGLQ